MARPQGRQSLNVSLSQCLTRSQCLAVSMSHQVSSLRSQVSGPPHYPTGATRAGGRAGARPSPRVSGRFTETASYQALKGLTAMMPQYICPSFRSSVRMLSQPIRSAAATICAS